MTLFPWLRPFLSALLMLPLLSLAGWLTAKGIPVTETQVREAVDGILTFAIPIIASLAVVLRRLIDKKVNPANTASSHLAEVGKVTSAAIKAAENDPASSATLTGIAAIAPSGEPVPPMAKIPSKERGGDL